MKKIYYIVVAIVVCIFAYWIILSIPSVSNKVLTITSTSLNNESFSTTGNFAFKNTPERLELLSQMLNINLEFINSPPIEATKTTKTTIKNFYKLEKFFPNFTSYYVAKDKIQTSLFTKLTSLITDTSSLSEQELQTYFNNNKPSLEKYWGINNFSEFSNIIKNLKAVNTNKITKYELEDSYFYIDSINCLNFRILLTLNNNENIYLGVQVYMFENNDYQTSPVIRFIDTSGGSSYV